MGRKRKAKTAPNQDIVSNDCSETTIAILEKHSHSSRAITAKTSDTGKNVHSNCNGLSPKSETKAMDVVLRRSCRLMNAVPLTEGLQMVPTMGHLNISESKGEGVSLVQQANTRPILNERVITEELPHVQPVVTAPILNQRTMEDVQPVVTAPILNKGTMEAVQRVVAAPISNQRTMEADIPYVPGDGTMPIVNEKNLVDKFGFLTKVFCEYVSKTDKQVHKARDEGPSTELNYKSLYIDSQKKIESLTAEKFHLSLRLEFALGKIEAYEKTIAALCASKEVVLFPSPQPLKKQVLQSFAAPLAVIGHETSCPEPEKPKKKRTYKKKKAVS